MSGGRYLNPNSKPKKGKKIVFIVLGVILVLIAAVLIGGYMYLQSMLNLINVVPSVSTTAPTAQSTTQAAEETPDSPSEASEPTETTSPEETWPQIVSEQNVTNIMLVGQSYREGEESKLSDTMILCSINRETNTLVMTSFLRDLFVPLPAYAGHTEGRNRINVCYNLGWKWTDSTAGGMEMLALCVEKNFGIPVHHTVEVDFIAFLNIIDLMGGVEIELTEAEAKYINNEVGYIEREMQPGLQTLTGMEALAYARIRAIDNDFNRTNRQRTVINSLLNGCRKLGLMELHKLATEILPMITTNMTTEEMTNYIWEFLPMLRDLNIVSQTCPLDGSIVDGSYWYTYKENIGYVIECNLWANKKFLQEQLGFADEQ